MVEIMRSFDRVVKIEFSLMKVETANGVYRNIISTLQESNTAHSVTIEHGIHEEPSLQWRHLEYTGDHTITIRHNAADTPAVDQLVKEILETYPKSLIVEVIQ